MEVGPRVAPCLPPSPWLSWKFCRVEQAVKTGSRSFPGEGGGSRDPERREMSIFSGGGSDNREAGDQGGPMAPLAKVIW